MLFSVLYGFLLFLSSCFSLASSFRIASRDYTTDRVIFEQIFKDAKEKQKVPDGQPVLIRDPADPEVGVSSDPMAYMRAVSGVDSPITMSKSSMVTSDFVIYDKLPGGQGGFQLDNALNQKGIIILLTTHGTLTITLSIRFMRRVVKQTSQIKHDPAEVATKPKFDYFVSHLILGEQAAPDPPQDDNLKTLVDNPPKYTLKRFINEMKERDGTPLRLVTSVKPIKLPGGQVDAAVFEAAVWKIKQLVDPNLPIVSLGASVEESPKTKELGISTYRGSFEGQNAQYVSLIYGDRGGISAMIPTVSNVAGECETGLQTNILGGYDPTITHGKFAEHPESSFNLPLARPAQDPAILQDANKPITFLVVTTLQFWLLAVPPSYLQDKFGPGSRTAIAFRSMFRDFIETYLDHGIFDFVKNMDETEKIVAYVAVAGIVKYRGAHKVTYGPFFYCV